VAKRLFFLNPVKLFFTAFYGFLPASIGTGFDKGYDGPDERAKNYLTPAQKNSIFLFIGCGTVV
jgi:hypothetical protein